MRYFLSLMFYVCTCVPTGLHISIHSLCSNRSSDVALTDVWLTTDVAPWATHTTTAFGPTSPGTAVSGREKRQAEMQLRAVPVLSEVGQISVSASWVKCSFLSLLVRAANHLLCCPATMLPSDCRSGCQVTQRTPFRVPMGGLL